MSKKMGWAQESFKPPEMRIFISICGSRVWAVRKKLGREGKVLQAEKINYPGISVKVHFSFTRLAGLELELY